MLLPGLLPSAFILCLIVALVAGVVKGAVGFAMPLIMVSGMGMIIDPKHALAGLILPIVLSNGLQAFREGWQSTRAAVVEHWRYLLIVGIAIFSTAQVVVHIPSQVFFLILGVSVLSLSLMQLLGVSLSIPPERRKGAAWVVGGISGILGGLAGTWGPTTVLYLMAIETPKARQMVVQGVIYGVGSVVLLAGYLKAGILNGDTVWFSAALVPAGLIGLWIGFRIGYRLDQKLFRRITLIVLVAASLNLIRKGVMG